MLEIQFWWLNLPRSLLALSSVSRSLESSELLLFSLNLIELYVHNLRRISKVNGSWTLVNIDSNDFINPASYHLTHVMFSRHWTHPEVVVSLFLSLRFFMLLGDKRFGFIGYDKRYEFFSVSQFSLLLVAFTSTCCYLRSNSFCFQFIWKMVCANLIQNIPLACLTVNRCSCLRWYWESGCERSWSHKLHSLSSFIENHDTWSDCLWARLVWQNLHCTLKLFWFFRSLVWRCIVGTQNCCNCSALLVWWHKHKKRFWCTSCLGIAEQIRFHRWNCDTTRWEDYRPSPLRTRGKLFERHRISYCKLH